MTYLQDIRFHNLGVEGCILTSDESGMAKGARATARMSDVADEMDPRERPNDKVSTSMNDSYERVILTS